MYRKGFSLIEILVVILIIGIMSSVAMLAFGDFGASRKVLIAAEQFSNHLKLLQQKAILEASSFRVALQADGYKTYRLEANHWQPVSGNPFAWQPFPKEARLTFSSAEIIVYASGNMSPFQLDFGTQGSPKLVTVVGYYNGALKLNHEKP